MTQFRYVAVEPSAGRIEGRMDAASKSAVVDHLHSLGQFPIRVDEIGALSFLALDLSSLRPARRFRNRDLALVTSQLSLLLHAGLSLDEALGISSETVDAPYQKKCLQGLRDGIRAGSTFSNAMAAQGTLFPPFYVSMVRAGEAGATLEAVLGRLSEYLERTEATKEHIKSALLYPFIVAAVCCCSVGVLFAFVVPRFRPLFEQAHNLPLSARALLAVSDAVESYWWVGMIALLGATMFAYQQLRNAESRQRWELHLLRLPFVGDIIKKIQIVHFSRTLATLLRNGVALLSALSITRETLRVRVFFDAVTLIIDDVKTGKGLAAPMKAAKIFPNVAVHLVRIGEESGRQEDMLFKIAELFESESRRRIDRMLALVGPALTVILGVIVAVVIGSILTAVLSVYDLAS